MQQRMPSNVILNEAKDPLFHSFANPQPFGAWLSPVLLKHLKRFQLRFHDIGRRTRFSLAHSAPCPCIAPL
jgi:hypothetical protein